MFVELRSNTQCLKPVFIEAKRINNFKYDGLETRFLHNSDNSPAYIKTLIFTKGGVKFPENYDTETLQKDDPNDNFTDPQVIRGFVDAITQFAKLSRTMVSPANTYQNSYEFDTQQLDGGAIAGVGMAYDQISGQGVDFSTQNFGIRMDTNLITDVPTGLYLFVHSKNTIVFNGSGIQILK